MPRLDFSKLFDEPAPLTDRGLLDPEAKAEDVPEALAPDAQSLERTNENTLGENDPYKEVAAENSV